MGSSSPFSPEEFRRTRIAKRLELAEFAHRASEEVIDVEREICYAQDEQNPSQEILWREARQCAVQKRVEAELDRLIQTFTEEIYIFVASHTSSTKSGYFLETLHDMFTDRDGWLFQYAEQLRSELECELEREWVHARIPPVHRIMRDARERLQYSYEKLLT